MIISLSDLISMCKIQKNSLLSNEVRKANYFKGNINRLSLWKRSTLQQSSCKCDLYMYTCVHEVSTLVKQEYERAWGKLFNPLNSRHNFCLPFQSKKAPQRIPFTTAKFVRRHSPVPACLNSILLSTWVTNVSNSAVRCVARCFGHAVTSVIILAFTQVHVCFFIMQPSLYSGFLAF